MTVIAVGVIAEDESDVVVIAALIRNMVPYKRHAIKKFLGHGCGKIKAKCNQWARHLKLLGCRTLIVVYDLDSRVLGELKHELQKALDPCPIKRNVIVIPVREIEAWLLSDSKAIERALNLSGVKKIPNPEAVFDPKKKLGEIIYLRSGKRKYYVSTLHNGRIAGEASLPALRRCSSFRPLESFAKSNL